MGMTGGMTGIWPCDGHVVMSSFAALGCILYHGLMSIYKPAVSCNVGQSLLVPCSRRQPCGPVCRHYSGKKLLTELWWLQWPFPLSCNKTFAESLLL